MQPQAELVPNGHPTTWKRHNDGCWVITILDQPFNEPSTGLFAILERHALLFPSLELTDLHQPVCHTNPDQEHGHEDQDEHEQHVMMRPAFFLLPMDFPGNVEVTGMTKHDVLLVPH